MTRSNNLNRQVNPIGRVRLPDNGHRLFSMIDRLHLRFEYKSPESIPADYQIPTTRELKIDFAHLAKHMRNARDEETRRYVDLLYERHLKFNIWFAMRANSTEPLPVGHYTCVFVWDLEYLTELREKDLRILAERVRRYDYMGLNRLVQNVASSVGFEDLENVEVNAVENIDDGLSELNAYNRQFRELKNFYTSLVPDEDSIFSDALLEKCSMVEEKDSLCETARFMSTQWKKLRTSWDLVNTKSTQSPNHRYANIGLTKRGIPRTASELIAAGLSSFLPIENLYSRNRQNNSSVWQRIQERFGPKCRLIYITHRFRMCPKGMSIGVFDARAELYMKYITNGLTKYLV